MDYIFMNSKHIKIYNMYRLLINITEKINWKRKYKYAVWSNFSIYYIWKNINISYENNEFIISVPTFNLLDWSYSISYIRGCFEYVTKLHQTFADNPKTQIYINKIETRITSKIKNEFYF